MPAPVQFVGHFLRCHGAALSQNRQYQRLPLLDGRHNFVIACTAGVFRDIHTMSPPNKISRLRDAGDGYVSEVMPHKCKSRLLMLVQTAFVKIEAQDVTRHKSCSKSCSIVHRDTIVNPMHYM